MTSPDLGGPKVLIYKNSLSINIVYIQKQILCYHRFQPLWIIYTFIDYEKSVDKNM